MWFAVSGVEVPRSLNQRTQVALQRSKLSDRAPDLRGSGAQQLEYVTARRLAVVAERDDAANLAEAESDRLRGADEGKPIDDVGVELSIARRRPGGRLEQTDLFVVAERLRCNARSPGDLADKHRLTFQCTGSLTVAAVDIDILYVTECPHIGHAVARLSEALDVTGLSASIRETIVDTPEAAEALGMRGSPTFLFNGRDPFASSDESGSLSCRLYPIDNSLDGIPSVDLIVTALRS